MPECRWLDDAETLTYLHSTVSTKRHRVRVPETPIYLDALLADEPLTGGLEPRLGAAHLRVLTINGFDISTAMQLAPGNNAGQALVGFTAGTGGAANVERHEITRWSFQSVVVPAPASAGILALAGLTAGRRRRR